MFCNVYIKRDVKMDIYELKREQSRFAQRVELQDRFARIKTIGGVDCAQINNKLVASVVVCEYPSMNLIEKKSFVLSDPLPYVTGFLAYREMPAIIEAFNKLENEPDLVLVDGTGILHPRKLGLASHLGLSLNIPTIGVIKKPFCGQIENSKVYLGKELVGFEIKTREHASPLYVSPGHLVSLGSCLKIIKDSIKPPHKLPEPIHIAHRVAKKKVKKVIGEIE